MEAGTPEESNCVWVSENYNNKALGLLRGFLTERCALTIEETLQEPWSGRNGIMQIVWDGRGRPSTPDVGVWCCIRENSEKPGSIPDHNGRFTKFMEYPDAKLLSGSGVWLRFNLVTACPREVEDWGKIQP